ncbi:MAG: GIY-YIG nuclease family protein [Anaerolineae bacterium]|nr:GIY-YIG nuclease family protein [Anaerolineae bacterium]
MHEFIPSTPGTYALLIQISAPIEITPGRLGSFSLVSGWYVYVGSARGPGGLAARLRRHLRPPEFKRAHWHIDHLLAQAPISRAIWVMGEERRECEWARQLLASPGAELPIPRFGASDCDCPSHLIRFTDEATATAVLVTLTERLDKG